MSVKKMNIRQQAFADYYIELGSAEQAALKAGYSKAYARGNAHKLLANVSVKAYIEKRMKEIDSERIADQQEVLELFSRIMRGEEEGTALVGVGQGAQVVKNVKPTLSEKLKAAETMGKLYSLWTDKVQVENITPNFIEDVPNDDE